MIDLQPHLGDGALLLILALMGLSAWEEEDGRRRRAREKQAGAGDPRHRRLIGRSQEMFLRRLSGWVYVAALLWRCANGSFTAGGDPQGRLSAFAMALAGVLGVVVLAAGSLLGRALAFPSGLRWPLAPYRGITMWVLWLWGLRGRVRRRSRPPAPRPAPAAEIRTKAARRGVAELASRSLEEIMIPRSQVAALAKDRPVLQAVAEVARYPHALYPVYGDSVDQPLGVVHILDLAVPESLSRPVGELARAVPVVPETMKGLALLREFHRAPVPAALVVDEFGGMAGLVTLEDLVEVLVGDLAGEHDIVRARIVPAGPGAFRVEGTCTVAEFNRFFGPLLPEGPYETVAGYVLEKAGKIPQERERYDLPRGSLQVLVRTDRRILSVLFEPALTTASAPASGRPVQSGPARRA